MKSERSRNRLVAMISVVFFLFPIFMDDTIIFSRSVEEHLVHLEEVFGRLRQANVKLNPKKCSFVKQKVEYLGRVVTP